MSWQSEFETGLVSALRANETLTALLADGSDSILQARPNNSASCPQVTFSHMDESYQPLASDGRFDIRLQLDIWAAAGAWDAIEDALLAVLDERARIRGGNGAINITATNFTCKAIRYLRGHTIPTGVFSADSDNAEIIQRVTEWTVRLYRK